MRKGKKLLITLGCLVAVALAYLLLVRQPREPQYNGRTLSEWAQVYSIHGVETVNGVPIPQANEADEAIRSIGTNALPHLLEWIRYEWPQWRLTVAQVTPHWLQPWVLRSQAHGRANLSVLAFKALGPAASNAVPELIQIAELRPIGERRDRARMALGYTQSPDALAFLGRTSRSPKIGPAFPTNAPPQ